MRPAVMLQYLLPHRALSRVVYWATRWTWKPWKDLLISRVVSAYRVDMEQAVVTDPCAYPTFNAFFTRALKPGARPLPDDPRALPAPRTGRSASWVRSRATGSSRPRASISAWLNCWPTGS